MSLIRTAAGYRAAMQQLEANRSLLAAETETLLSQDLTSEQAERRLRALHMRITDLESDVETYEAFRRGDLSGLEDQPLGIALIAARIAHGMSQATLARKTGLDTAQINRHEVNEYRSAGAAHIALIRQALELKISYGVSGGVAAEDRVHLERPSVTIRAAVFHRSVSAGIGTQRR
jgi:DNA-binding XRE family transcriptional regulator